MSLRRILLFTTIVALIGVGAGTTTAAAEPNLSIDIESVDPEEPTTDNDIRIDVELSNLEASSGPVEVTSAYLREDGTAETHSRVGTVGDIAPGGSITLPMTAAFDDAGDKRLTLHVIAVSADGTTESYEHPILIDVSESRVAADLTTATADGLGSVDVTLTNVGNRELENPEIAAMAGEQAVERRSLTDIGVGANRSAVFDLGNVTREVVTFETTYTIDGATHHTTETVDLDDQLQVPGQIRLTGIEQTPTGTGLRLEGDAANIGGTDVESVLVSVPETDDIRPQPPSATYFVGEVEASEFATFELTASATQNTSTVPVTITYVVDNVQRTTQQRLSITPPAAVESVDESSGGGLPLLPLLVGVLIVGAAGYYWRRR